MVWQKLKRLLTRIRYGYPLTMRESVVANFATTASDGKTYQVDYYNLDVIISVGYRVTSECGTQFRIWATNILKEYMRKGFALDDECLKNLGSGGYFKKLLERIRDIRAPEKVFYRQVRRRRKLFTQGQMLKKILWDLQHLPEISRL